MLLYIVTCFYFWDIALNGESLNEHSSGVARFVSDLTNPGHRRVRSQ